MSRRIRTIKPEALDDDKTAGLSHVAWRLFISGLLLSDDYGNLRAGVTYLAGQVFHSCPHTDSDQIRTAVDELVEAGLWQVYTVRGQTYAHIRGWAKHQRIDNAGKPRVPAPGEADGTRPISAPCEEKAFAANRRESPRVAASRRGSRLEGDRDLEGTRTWSESACAGAPAPARAFDKSPDTSPSGRVVAEVVSTEPPPSRLPPVPVEVAPSVPATVPPSSHATAPLAAFDAEDDDQPPPAQRVPSTPRPEPVAAVAPTAPVEAAPPVAPAPPVAVASPSGQTALLPDLAPVPAEDAPPVAIPRVADLDDRTPANRVLRAWGATCYRVHQQPLATEARRRVVRDRLRVFSEADLIRAITGAMADPYVNGQSDRAPSGGQRDIAWLFAKVERVEGFLRNAPAPRVEAPPAPTPTPKRPPPLPPHLAGRPAPQMDLATFLARGLTAPAPRRLSEEAAHVG